MEKLDLSKCTTNEEVCTLVAERIQMLSMEEVQNEIKKTFVFMDSTVEAIYSGLSMNMNVFLSGEGGFGKSSIVKSILDLYKIPYSTIVGYRDMPVDALLGIPDMEKLLRASTYEIDFTKSIFHKPGIIIAEEFGEVLPSTAAVMKDILTERGYRQGNTKTESLIASIVATSNKSANDISVDASMHALYLERFQIHKHVGWDSYTASNFMSLLTKTIPDADEEALYFMAKLFESNFIDYNKVISPRNAIAITTAFNTFGLSTLTNFNVDTSAMFKVKEIADKEFKLLEDKSTLKEIEAYIAISEDTLDNKLAVMAVYLLVLRNIDKIEVDNNFLADLGKFRILLESKIESISKQPVVVDIDNLFRRLGDGTEV